MYKKQKIIFIELEIICFIFVIVGVGIYNKSWFLFPDIQQEDVLSIEVVFGAYPNYPLTKRDQIKLVDYMRQIEVSRTKEDYREYTGLISKMFVLHMNEDSDITISASPPFLSSTKKDTCVAVMLYLLFAGYIIPIQELYELSAGHCQKNKKMKTVVLHGHYQEEYVIHGKLYIIYEETR
jgi:hypothetical protein